MSLTPTRPSKITQFANFTRTSAGLEKTLRLIQAVAQIATEVSIDRSVATQWGAAKGQLALCMYLLSVPVRVDMSLCALTDKKDITNSVITAQSTSLLALLQLHRLL